jgi:hypothetical protein
MADLRARFVEDYAGGLLNISRQEFSTTGEVLAQDALPSESTIFVEDGTGSKSGLKLGISLAEAVDPTTEQGIVNVRFADRTYAKIRDLKIFSTAIASAQAALSDATSGSISNLEVTLQLLEDDVSTLETTLQNTISSTQEQLLEIEFTQRNLSELIDTQATDLQNLTERVTTLEQPTSNPLEITPLTEITNSFYYQGTIQIAGGSAIGTNTDFTRDFNIGDVFITKNADGEEIEFTVRGFDNVNPSTAMLVTPTDETVPALSRFSIPRELEIQKKINEIIFNLRLLGLII